MLEGDPAAESGAHLTQAEARRAWEEGLTMTVEQAVALARAETAG